MGMTKPDKWCLFEADDGVMKVFATWSGGYLDGDSWQVNSGIDRIEEEGDYYLFHGFSGSIYKCHQQGYGITAYGSGVLREGKITPLALDEAISYMAEKLKQ